MKKYIIRKCPAYSCNGICGADEELFCKDCDNCLLKLIVEIVNKVRLTPLKGHDYEWGKMAEIEKMFDKFMIGSGETLEKLQQENEELKKKNKELLNLSNYGGALLVAESTKNKKYKQALEEIRDVVKPIKDNTCFGMNCGAVDWILSEIDEVLNEK